MRRALALMIAGTLLSGAAAWTAFAAAPSKDAPARHENAVISKQSIGRAAE